MKRRKFLKSIGIIALEMKIVGCGDSALDTRSPESDTNGGNIRERSESSSNIRLSSDTGIRERNNPPKQMGDNPPPSKDAPALDQGRSSPPKNAGGDRGLPLKDSVPLVLNSNNNDIKISGRRFSNVKDDGSYAIDINGANSIEITDCLFEDVRWAIRVRHSTNININGCRFVDCGEGIRISDSESIKCDYNEFFNIGGLKASGGKYGGYWAQQAIGFIEVRGSGVSTSHNIIDNSQGNCPYVEDFISYWNSGGASSSWADIGWNRIRGGLPGSNTGTGMVLGDAHGAKELYSQYYHIHDNIIVRAQNIGIGIASGHDMTIEDNVIYQPREYTQRLTKHPLHNQNNTRAGGGITVYDYSKSGLCHTISILNNKAFAVRMDGMDNSYWHDQKTCINVTTKGNAWYTKSTVGNNLSDNLLPSNMFLNLSDKYFSGRR